MTTTMLTLGAAARLAQVGKSTLSRAIKSGRMSATRTETGGYQVEVSELARLYGPLPGAEAAHATVAAPVAPVQDAIPDATVDRLVALLREHLDDMRRQRDAWQSQAERLSLAPPSRPSWWRRWRSSPTRR